MKTKQIIASPVSVLLAAFAFSMLNGCSSPSRSAGAMPVPAPKKIAAAVADTDPAHTLAARWARNEAGDAVKDFKHSPGTYLRGEVYGYWPEGAMYEVSRVNKTARTLHLRLDTKETSEENEYHHFSAEVKFTSDGQHMTMLRHHPNHIPDEKLTYYRAP